MRTKRNLALLFTFVLLLGTCMPFVGAASTSGDQEVTSTSANQDIVVESKLNVPTIEVTIADAPPMIANPYKLSYSKNTSIGAITDDKTLVTSPALITNASAVAVNITAKPTASTNVSGLVIAASQAPAGATKWIYMELYMSRRDDDILTGVDLSESSLGLTPVVVKTSDPDPISIKLEKKEGTTNTYGAYQIAGETGGTPSSWVETDKVNVSIVFDIQPTVDTPAGP